MEKNKNFGQAIEALKEGKRIAREGWNGKNMFVYLNKGNVDWNVFQKLRGTTRNILICNIKHELYEKGDTGTTIRTPNLNMKAADDSTVTGWLASQTDILAEDWCVLD